MGKFLKMINDLKLNRYDLKELVRDAQIALDGLRPFYIKEYYKKCGKPTCWCSAGEGHGPYNYVTWTERGRQRQKSLGLKVSIDEIQAIYNKRRPDWLDFIVVGKELKKLQNDPQKSNQLHERYLNDVDFEKFYGMYKSEDGLNRPDHLFYNWHEYEKSVAAHDEEQNRLYTTWSRYGVISAKAHSILSSMVERGFYLSD